MKARKDSVLKSRALKTREFGDKLFGWISEPKTDKCVGGAAHAKKELAKIGIAVSERTISDFYSWWGLRQAYENAAGHAEQQKELMLKFDPNDVERAEKFGDFVFLQEAIALKDPDSYVAIGGLREKRKTRELKQEELNMKLRRLELLENNSVKARKELQKLRDPKSDLTEADRKAIVQKVDEILGIKAPA